MNYGILIIKLIFLFFILSPLISYGTEPSDLNKAIEEKVRALQEVSAQIEKTQKEIEASQNQQKTLQKELGNLNYTINQANLSIKSTEINIDKLNLEIESLQYNIEDAESSIKNKRGAISKFLQRLQQKDNETTLLLILKEQSLADSLFELQGIENLNKQFSVEVTSLQKIQNELKKTYSARNEKKSQLVLENSHLKNRKGILSDQKNNRATLLLQTKNREQIYQQQLGELERKQRAISDEIGDIEDE